MFKNTPKEIQRNLEINYNPLDPIFAVEKK